MNRSGALCIAHSHFSLLVWPQPPIAVSHVWELRRTVDTLSNAMSRVEDPQLWSILDESRTRFLCACDGRMDELPHGVVHHDLHDANLLVDASEEAVTGVLDFGDMVWGPRIAELAVPAAYASRGAAQPVEAFIQVAEGWGSSIDLQAEEIDLLLEAAIGRLAVNLAVWTARGQSERGGYALSRSKGTERVLREFLCVDADALRRELRRILGH
ncbi:phosphotransferase [Brevibacterium antiquum]|uniref:phosphotransferase n=1 Tax=Brevibacterium antiquum TaxID=234835 RepID=UPI0022B75B49|nr:phosphotransferase [Brevibacterium antiquum]